MTTWVALLRGINLGPHHKVPMADLRALCADLGFTEVRTYIASGNVVCSSSHRSATAVRTTVERGLRSRFGFDVPVVVRTPAQLRTVPTPTCAHRPGSASRGCAVRSRRRWTPAPCARGARSPRCSAW